MPPRKGKSLGSASSTSSSNIREPVGIASEKDFSPLEQCINDQQCNQRQIDDIADRISALINRLRGHSLSANGQAGGEGDYPKDIGLLGELKDSLKLEGQSLGDIQCDLAVLESLL